MSESPSSSSVSASFSPSSLSLTGDSAAPSSAVAQSAMDLSPSPSSANGAERSINFSAGSAIPSSPSGSLPVSLSSAVTNTKRTLEFPRSNPNASPMESPTHDYSSRPPPSPSPSPPPASSVLPATVQFSRVSSSQLHLSTPHQITYSRGPTGSVYHIKLFRSNTPNSSNQSGVIPLPLPLLESVSMTPNTTQQEFQIVEMNVPDDPENMQANQDNSSLHTPSRMILSSSSDPLPGSASASISALSGSADSDSSIRLDSSLLAPSDPKSRSDSHASSLPSSNSIPGSVTISSVAEDSLNLSRVSTHSESEPLKHSVSLSLSQSQSQSNSHPLKPSKLAKFRSAALQSTSSSKANSIALDSSSASRPPALRYNQVPSNPYSKLSSSITSSLSKWSRRAKLEKQYRSAESKRKGRKNSLISKEDNGASNGQSESPVEKKGSGASAGGASESESDSSKRSKAPADDGEHTKRVQKTFLQLSSFMIFVFVAVLIYYDYIILSPHLNSIAWAILWAICLNYPQQTLKWGLDYIDVRVFKERGIIQEEDEMNENDAIRASSGSNRNAERGGFESDRLHVNQRKRASSSAEKSFRLNRKEILLVVSTLLAAISLYGSSLSSGLIYLGIYSFWLFLLYGDRQTVSSLLILILLILCFLFPLVFAVKTMIDEIAEMSTRLQSFIEGSQEFQQIITDWTESSIYLWIRESTAAWGLELPQIDLQQVKDFATSKVDYLSKQLTGVFSSFISVVANFTERIVSAVTFFSFLYYFLVQAPVLSQSIGELSPFANSDNVKLKTKVTDSVTKVFYCSFKIGVSNFLVSYITFRMCGVDLCLILSFVSGFASMLPVFSSWIVWCPVCVALYILGRPIQAFFLLSVQLTMLMYVNQEIYKEMQGDSYLSGMAIAMGVYQFGFIGVLAGPLLAGLTSTIVTMYKEYVTKKNAAPPPNQINLNADQPNKQTMQMGGILDLVLHMMARSQPVKALTGDPLSPISAASPKSADGQAASSAAAVPPTPADGLRKRPTASSSASSSVSAS